LEHKRKCIACGEIKSRSDLIKITKEYTSGDTVIMPNSKTFGRSAYLCYNKDCISMAFKKNKLNKMLKNNTEINKDILLNLVQQKQDK